MESQHMKRENGRKFFFFWRSVQENLIKSIGLALIFFTHFSFFILLDTFANMQNDTILHTNIDNRMKFLMTQNVSVEAGTSKFDCATNKKTDDKQPHQSNDSFEFIFLLYVIFDLSHDSSAHTHTRQYVTLWFVFLFYQKQFESEIKIEQKNLKRLKIPINFTMDDLLISFF